MHFYALSTQYYNYFAFFYIQGMQKRDMTYMQYR